MNVIVIVGHNHFASGVYSSLAMIAGTKESIIPIDFETEDTDQTLQEKMIQALKNYQTSSILFACDLLGGTPYKECAKYAYEHQNCEVVTGFNLGGLLDASFKMDKLTIQELATTLIDSSKKNILLLPKKIEETAKEEGI